MVCAIQKMKIAKNMKGQSPSNMKYDITPYVKHTECVMIL